jgi:signal peptidase I
MTANLPTLQTTTSAAPFLYTVASDSMAPTYRAGQNSVICVPVEGYTCEGVYLVDMELYRCERTGGTVHVWRDNPAMPDYTVDVGVFNSSKLALVVADITVRNAIGREILSGSLRPGPQI